MEPKHKNVFSALAAAQATMDRVVKGAVNPAFKGEGKPQGTRYADLADVVSAVRPALAENGLAFFHQMVIFDSKPAMRTVLCHGESDTSISCDVPLIVDKNNMQGMKSATTYAKRIGLESVTGVAPEDDDGNAAAAAAPREDRKQAGPTQDDIDAAIGAINAATTGQALLAAIPKHLAKHPAIRNSIVENLRTIVKGAQSTKALEIMADHFRPVWSEVEADATARADELRGEAPF